MRRRSKAFGLSALNRTRITARLPGDGLSIGPNRDDNYRWAVPVTAYQILYDYYHRMMGCTTEEADAVATYVTDRLARGTAYDQGIFSKIQPAHTTTRPGACHTRTASDDRPVPGRSR